MEIWGCRETSSSQAQRVGWNWADRGKLSKVQEAGRGLQGQLRWETWEALNPLGLMSRASVKVGMKDIEEETREQKPRDLGKGLVRRGEEWDRSLGTRWSSRTGRRALQALSLS